MYSKSRDLTPSDTPWKPKHVVRTKEGRIVKAGAEAMVEQDLQDHTYVADTKAFLDHYFPVAPEVIDNVYQSLVDNQYYNATEKVWSGKKGPDEMVQLPVSGKEVGFYEPLISICEAIRTAYTGEPNEEYQCRWVLSPNLAPESKTEPKASAIRPDAFLLLGMQGEADEWQRKFTTIQNHMKLREDIKASWVRIGVIMEVKKRESDDILEHIQQLMLYARQVLLEQLDRWFVPGLLFAKKQLAVWVVDRSGILGTEKSIDIHENPKEFIQVILACSILSPVKLGWDMTMKLWHDHQLKPSYSSEVKDVYYGENNYYRRWVLEMPIQNTEGEVVETEQFITTKALSLARTERLHGRITVVWAAQKLEAKGVPNPGEASIYVLKQCWRPEKLSPEGELYPPSNEANQHYTGCVYTSKEVYLDKSRVDTAPFIRGQLKFVPATLSSELNVSGKRFASAEENEPYMFITSVEEDSFQPIKPQVEPRVLTRTLLKDSFGWPITRFQDLQELVRVCNHVVQALEWLYYEKKTLQRDISPGNVMITPVRGKETQGCIIDFDYAKVIEHTTPTTVKAVEPEGIVVKPNLMKQVSGCIFHDQDLPPVVRRAFAWVQQEKGSFNWNDYLNGLERLIPRKEGSYEITFNDVGLFAPSERTEVPDVSKHKPQSGERRTATVAFASPEVLSGARIWPHLGVPPPPHDARHDLEALFWVMTYICITRQGPGGEKRQILAEASKSETTEDLKNASDPRFIHGKYFSGNVADIIKNKCKIFNDDSYATEIVPSFHSYFDPLKSLMIEWFNLLSVAHRFSIFETIHGRLRGALDSTHRELQNVPLHRDKSDAVAERREIEMRYLQRRLATEEHQENPICPVASGKDQ
ncbi:hypothetical protein H0H92_005656 [Tricholoma furcatifolium]|nr:hypothetical protein H0H92_005656 [Tricholoma furcatifolium]